MRLKVLATSGSSLKKNRQLFRFAYFQFTDLVGKKNNEKKARQVLIFCPDIKSTQHI
jgi:hypothetical protein